MNFPAWLSEQDIQPTCNSGMPVSPPKVLVTTPYFKPSSGGAQEYCYQITRGLQTTKDWKVVIVTSGYKNEITTENYESLKVYRLPYRLKISNTPLDSAGVELLNILWPVKIPISLSLMPRYLECSRLPLD